MSSKSVQLAYLRYEICEVSAIAKWELRVRYCSSCHRMLSRHLVRIYYGRSLSSQRNLLPNLASRKPSRIWHQGLLMITGTH